MAVLQIAVLVSAVVILWLAAIALIVVWVMGMSRNAAMDEETLRRHTVEARDTSGSESPAAPDRTPA